MPKTIKSLPDINIEERRTMRFAADDHNLAGIDLNIDTKQFAPSINALVIDESSQGCGLVTIENESLKEGQTIVLSVGRLSPLKAEIQWCRRPAPNILLLGCKYLE